ncbi:hypothetical protein B0H10DRAFT_1963342 [Mycena sp. CBHHK59/15]|nr:hypothetical protein B0H10DRAFT_1963342 [Mycena sp. CBHHK59/15]
MSGTSRDSVFKPHTHFCTSKTYSIHGFTLWRLQRGKAFVDKTFSRTLAPESDIYPILSDLLLMDFHVGKDDITADKDAKHIFKRGCNRLLRMLGMKVFGVQITPAIIRVHLQQAGHLTQHINSVLRPDDKQDMELLYELLKDLWNPEGSCLGFIAARDALRIIGSLFYHLIFPYICVDLTLSEQLEHLSAAAHLNLLLYRDGQKEVLPTLLFTDIMIMIKNVYFCVAKAKVDDPTGNFWLILLGTDRLEELFGILRTMIGNDRNLDMLQLVERITGTTEVANIFAQYPHWDRPPRRLHLPALARDSTALPNMDHIKPGLWRGDTSVASVLPQTCWIRGRRLIEQELPALAKYFRALDTAYNVNILSPLGELIVHKDLGAAAAPKSSVSPDLEDAAVDEDVLDDSQAPTFSKFITVGNKPLCKTRALSLMQKYGYQAGSTDRLKRVADVQRYSAKSDEPSTLIESDSPYLLVLEPIATLVRCEEKLFVCIREVTDMRLDSKSNDQLSLDLLQERNIAVHFQILQLIPVTTEDDPDSKHDWRSTGVLRDVLIAPGRMVLPVDPTLSTRVVGKPHYLFESSVLRGFGAQLLQEVTLDLNKKIPKFMPTSNFPYRESAGYACFVCEGDSEIEGLQESDSHLCLKCTPPVALDVTRPQTVLTHMGAHILHDSTIARDDQPCGLCCRVFPMCHFVLKKTGDRVSKNPAKNRHIWPKEESEASEKHGCREMSREGSQTLPIAMSGLPDVLNIQDGSEKHTAALLTACAA